MARWQGFIVESRGHCENKIAGQDQRGQVNVHFHQRRVNAPFVRKFYRSAALFAGFCRPAERTEFICRTTPFSRPSNRPTATLRSTPSLDVGNGQPLGPRPTLAGQLRDNPAASSLPGEISPRRRLLDRAKGYKSSAGLKFDKSNERSAHKGTPELKERETKG